MGALRFDQKMGDFMKGMFLAFLVAVAAWSASSSSFAADRRNVTVVNGTGYGIKFLGFNNPGDDEWSDNELKGVFDDGEKIYVKFGVGDKGCVWNFKIEWADPGYPGVVWHKIDLCNTDVITLHYDRDSDTTSAELK